MSFVGPCPDVPGYTKKLQREDRNVIFRNDLCLVLGFKVKMAV